MKEFSHPDPEQMTAYVLGKLSWSEVETVEVHLGSCPACRSQVAALDGNADSFVSCLRDTVLEDAGGTELDQLLAVARSLPQLTASAVSGPPPKKVAGHELLRELARGGLGVVYLARHPILKDVRAIKRPQARDGLDREVLLARFRREVEAVGALRHDHIVRAHDAGTDEEGPYLVMEYLDGAPLSRLLARGPLLPAEACELVRQAALGLQAAHERGLVHRDVKPSNLILARAGADARVVVIDWGLVKRSEEAGPARPQADTGPTRAGTGIGTADYIAPEQIRDARSVDIRADIYSLGVTLYCLLAGKPPFHGRPELEKLLAHQREEFPALERMRSDIPAELQIILKKMVAKDPAARFASPAQVANALRPFCLAESGLVDLLDAKERTPPPPRLPPRIGWVLAVAACLLLAAVSLGFLVRALTRQEQQELPEEPNTPHLPGVLGDGPASPVRMKEAQPGYCSSLVFMADGLRAVSESGGGAVFVWDLKTRDHHSWLHFFKQPDKNQDLAGLVAVSPDGNYLVAAGLNAAPRDMNFLDLYDQRTLAKKKALFATFGKMGPALAFSPASSELAAVELPGLFGLGEIFTGPMIRIIDMKTGDKKSQFACRSAVNSLAFSPDGSCLLAGGDDKAVRLWRWPTQKQELSFVGHEGRVGQVAFSRDGKRAFSASSDDETLRVWNSDWKDKNAGTEAKRISIRSAAARMICATFWPGHRALSGHADGSIILWDLAKGIELKRFSHQGVQITAVAISTDGHHAVAAHSDHGVYLYRLPPPRAEP